MKEQMNEPKPINFNAVPEASDDFHYVLRALKSGNIPVVQEWLDSNHGVNTTFDDICNSPIMIAAYHGHSELVDFLVRRGANVRARNKDNSSLLQFAARHSSVLEIIIKTDAVLDIEHQDKRGFTALMQAVNINSSGFSRASDHDLVPDRILCINLLLDNGADVNQINSFGRSSLMRAAYVNSAPLVSALFDAGAKTDYVCSNEKQAADYASDDEIKQLIKNHQINEQTIMPAGFESVALN